ncbi:MAG TPA: peptidyl-dipeptidase Dcp [Gammaproteobacteria bacterium]|nr:peptidyl-dipeptidase Dcp [Gammaproteobacteria bacterium]
MFRNFALALAGALALSAAPLVSADGTHSMTPNDTARSNPFFAPSTLPFQAPPFDKITDSDYLPAIEAGMQRQLAEVQSIADNPAPPTFDNTLVALEKSGQLLTRVMRTFNLMTGANTDPALQKVEEDVAPKLAANQDAILLNAKLFKRVETIYNERDRLKLDPESRWLVHYYHQQFVLAGARLSEADKAKLKILNEEDASLSARFSNQLLAAANAAALVASDPSELAGLSPAQLQAAALTAKSRGLDGKWVIPLQNTTQQPDLGELTDRATREKLFEASWTRAERGGADDTRPTITRLAKLRAEEAKLLGYPDYASWVLQTQMAKTPANVQKFLEELIPPATRKARVEAAELQQIIDQDGGKFKLEPWDWDFYAEQLRKQKYNLDQAEIKPYFELNRVLEDGVFYAAHELYGISFKERHDLPVWQPDVRVFEVHDYNGKPLGLFYCDYFKRDNKSGGAWMDNLVYQSRLLHQLPVIYNVTNFSKPAPGQPALLSIDDVITMFHEFGHALNGFFADQEYPSLSGTATARDFVEYPSQFNEHWALYPKVLEHYAVNYQTGQPMPKVLLEKILKARGFNKGYDMTEMLAASELDMQWHTLPASAPEQNVDQFELAALKKTGVYLPQVPTRYRSSYFLHIWSNGYAAGYYAYNWTQMLADDSYQWFLDHGGLTRANGQRYRDLILSRGNTENYAHMFRTFYGRDPQIGPMLKYRYLNVN